MYLDSDVANHGSANTLENTLIGMQWGVAQAGRLVIRAAREKCYHNSHGQLICKKENFFHRVGRWIMTGILILAGLIFLLILCCCIRRRRAKKAKAANGYPMGQA